MVAKNSSYTEQQPGKLILGTHILKHPWVSMKTNKAEDLISSDPLHECLYVPEEPCILPSVKCYRNCMSLSMVKYSASGYYHYYKEV